MFFKTVAAVSMMAGLALLGAVRPALAQVAAQGTTVDDFQYVAGYDSRAAAAAADAWGNVYVVGSGNANNTSPVQQRWIVRKLSSAGTSAFATVDNFQYAGSTSEATGVAPDNLGNLYVVGRATDSKGYYRWIVRKSADQGATWKTVDAYSLGRDTSAYGVCASASGAIYVVGTGSNVVKSSVLSYWTVRKSVDGGATWSTADSFQLPGGSGGYAYSIAEDAAGNLYVAGQARDSASRMHWVVRRGTPGGGSWTTMDDFQYVPGQQVWPKAVAVDNASGSVYVTGWASYAAGNPPHALLRKASVSGGGFITVNDNNGKQSSCLLIGPSGELVQGLGYGNELWGVRVSYDGGATFTAIDEFQMVPGKWCSPAALTKVGSSVFGVGSYGDAGNIGHWITRQY